MPDWVSELVRYGPLGLFAAGVCFAIWKIGVYSMHRLLDQGGLVGQWVDGEKQWRSALTERIESQQVQCGEHVTCIRALTDSVKADTSMSEIANKHLERLVVLHEERGSIGKAATTISASHEDIQRCKQALCQACTMFTEVSEKEFPNSAQRVAYHCKEIERIIGEA